MWLFYLLFLLVNLGLDLCGGVYLLVEVKVVDVYVVWMEVLWFEVCNFLWVECVMVGMI